MKVIDYKAIGLACISSSLVASYTYFCIVYWNKYAGDIITGTSTIIGAVFVIIAAFIQAKGSRDTALIQESHRTRLHKIEMISWTHEYLKKLMDFNFNILSPFCESITDIIKDKEIDPYYWTVIDRIKEYQTQLDVEEYKYFGFLPRHIHESIFNIWEITTNLTSSVKSSIFSSPLDKEVAISLSNLSQDKKNELLNIKTQSHDARDLLEKLIIEINKTKFRLIKELQDHISY